MPGIFLQRSSERERTADSRPLSPLALLRRLARDPIEPREQPRRRAKRLHPVALDERDASGAELRRLFDQPGEPFRANRRDEQRERRAPIRSGGNLGNLHERFGAAEPHDTGRALPAAAVQEDDGIAGREPPGAGVAGFLGREAESFPRRGERGDDQPRSSVTHVHPFSRRQPASVH